MNAAGEPSGRLRLACGNARLQRGERWLSGRVETHDLAVDQRVATSRSAGDARELGEACGDVGALRRSQHGSVALDLQQTAHAVPLDLEGPVVAARQFTRHGLHRTEGRWRWRSHRETVPAPIRPFGCSARRLWHTRPMSRRPPRRILGLHPETWAGLSPNGIGQQKPHHLREMLDVARINRKRLPYAWRVLNEGVCDGCALGVAGLHDWTLDGIHLCTTRLRMLEFNTADVMDPAVAADPSLGDRSLAELRSLGRLGHPLRRRRGEPGFRRISWSEALQAVGAAHRSADPDRIAWYLTSRGLTNETYYTAGKAARALGIANIDSAARVCHSPSSVGLKATTGVAAATCSMRDVLETDLVVLWGTNPANNQPVFMKYLDQAIKAGTRVVVVNPLLEAGLDRYWVPSAVESYVFGTKIAHLHVPVRPGGTIWPGGSRRSRPTACWRQRGSIGRVSTRSSSCTASPTVPSTCGRWASPSIRTAPTAFGRSSMSGSPAGTSGETVPGSCRSGGTPGCRAAPRWARMRRPFPGNSRSTVRRRRASPNNGASPSPATPV